MTVSEIGRGGFGVVYRARHRGSGREVALKTVRAPTPSRVVGMRREIRALARVSHPGIVRILEHGVTDGVPWFAMELYEGRTLRSLLRSPGAGPARLELPTPAEHPNGPEGSEGPASLSEKLTLVRSICAPLAYLHGEGIVHRDLKPENVLLIPGEGSRLGRPVLLDFGLTVGHGAAGGREVLELRGDPSGSMSYMAPEQARGAMVDARADLYSLGCILFELLTGKPPEGKRASLIESMPDAPSRLDELVGRLLAPRARDRLGYASDVARTLEALGAGGGDVYANAPSPRSHLYLSALVGRDASLEFLVRNVGAVGGSQEPARHPLVMIGGESGIGKTRLINEAARRMRQRGVQVLIGTCPSPQDPRSRSAESQVPLGALKQPLQVIADRCRAPGGEYLDSVVRSRAGVLHLYEPGLGGGEAEPSGLARATEQEARRRIFEGLDEAFFALAVDGPVALILDDLQWADGLTLGYLEHRLAAGPGAGGRLTLLGAYRSDEQSPQLGGVVQRAQSIDLSRLAEAEVGRMVSDMLALEQPPEPFVRFLARQAEGVPFFVAEYLHLAVAEGIIRRDDAGRWSALGSDEAALEALPLPANVVDLVARRLKDLDPDSRRVLETAAVMGRHLDRTVLGGATDLDDDPLAEVMVELVARQVLRDDEAGLYFAHDKFREAAYLGIPTPQQKTLHLEVAQAMERARRPGDDADLGSHWARAGDLERARPHILKAARRAVTEWELDRAELLFHRYLEISPEPSRERVKARIYLANDVLRPRGKLETAMVQGRKGLEEAQEISEQQLAMTCRAIVAVLSYHLGDVEEARKGYEEGVRQCRLLGDRQGEVLQMTNLASLLAETGREGGHRLAREALEIAREMGDPMYQGLALAVLVQHELIRGELEQAVLCADEAVECLQCSGARRLQIVSRSNRAVALRLLGRRQEAREVLDQALEEAFQVGDRFVEPLVLVNRAQMDLEDGRYAEAEQRLARTLRLIEEYGSLRYEGLALAGLAMVSRRRGDLEKAMAFLPRAEGLLRRVEDRIELGRCLCEKGHQALAAGRRADPMLAEARAIARELGCKSWSPLVQAVERLESSIDAANRGEALRYGDRASDLPDPDDPAPPLDRGGSSSTRP